MSSLRRGRLALVLVLALPIGASVCAQQLPLRQYGVSDGLASGEITSIYQDAKGYLWFSTYEGVSRFDGYRFINYDASDGLPQATINHVTADRKGRLWVATNKGIARLEDHPPPPARSGAAPAARTKFIAFKLGDAKYANQVNRILFDAQNRLWCLTDLGLYRATFADDRLITEPILVRESSHSSYASLEDRRGRLWFGVGEELLEINEGRVVNHGLVGGAGGEPIVSISEDGEERLLIASIRDLFTFTRPRSAGVRGEWRRLPLKMTPNHLIETTLVDRAGRRWLGTSAGLLNYDQQIEYTTAHGLSINSIKALGEDNDGNLWIGTFGGGACKLSRGGIVSYTQTEGLSHPTAVSVFEDQAGRVRAILADHSLVECAAGRVAISRQLDYLPQSSRSFIVSREEQGSWRVIDNYVWARIGNPVLRLRSGRDVDLRDLLPAAAAIHYFEDEGGRLWLSRDDGKIYRTDATRPGPLTVEIFDCDFSLTTALAMMVGDGAGGLWLGNKDNEDSERKLGRLRQGRFVAVNATEGLPETDPRALYLDSRGWLWIGLRYQGVAMTREPGAERPQFINYRAAEGGLSSNTVWAIAEDARGRIYFGTSKGLDRFDPKTGDWRNYTRADGLMGERIFDLHRDGDGRIWVAATRGLSIIDPGAEADGAPLAATYIIRVNIAGEDLLLPETGAAEIPAVALAAGRNNLSIEYVAPSYRGGEGLRYQYRLEGADDGWSAPTRLRSVNYGRLAPGAYRFLVRALSNEGKPGPSSATFAFRILPPLYLRWWFLTLAGGMIGAMVYLLYRYRVGRLLELERVRMRIAADLHDDIGSNLTRIAILSEVANSRIDGQRNGEGSGIETQLSSIARLARESVASMSDIVWAINPKKDSLIDLARRMRRLLEETLAPRQIEHRFRAPEIAQETRLGAGLRRDLFLIFKEAINNAVRHARCQQIEVDLYLERGYLVLRVSDDGIGFDTSEPGEGQGIINMRRRAEALEGEFKLSSCPGKGTTVSLRVLRGYSG